IFTTIVNPSGSTPVGTKAMDFVAEDVINGGKTMVYDNIDINGEIYVGCYIPIVNSDGAVAGMYFAGRPLRTAIDNVRMVIIGFISVVAVTLAISVTLCIVFTEKMIKDLGDIKQYINKIAAGDFDARMQEKTLKRDDEIGDIGRNAEKLYVNLRDMVERDPLTMLLNRRSCLMKMTEFTENKILYTVAMGDIDFFKKINDTYGHACGDYVLKEVSALLKRHTGDNEAFVSRWGGEEFLIVLPSKGTEESLRIVTEILEEIRKTNYEYEGKTFKVTMTFGISQFRNGDNRESAVNRADKLLYKGKQSGRNRIVV
ncbi:MAG: diguanylate cyclase, partial [Ruminiclostridium sp.]|nr:diguanylate cyclase [Ruminiclostridium sp.]